MKSTFVVSSFYIQFLLLAITFCVFTSCFSLKIGETCDAKTNNCDAGLRCQTCAANGNTRPRCVRIQPASPTSKVKGLAFNKYSWLTTHNSYALAGQNSLIGAVIVSPMNQEDSITNQLKNGVRGLMLDMYDFRNDIWLCHSFGGKCYDYTAFQPAINVLKEIQAFLEANPSEIVTIFIEDYVTSANGITNVLNASGLSKFLFPMSRMPKGGQEWPTIDDMVANNQRLVVFTSKSSKEDSEGLAYEWKYVVENQYGGLGMVPGSCSNRNESPPLNTTTIPLVLQNYFPENPNATQVCADNSQPLIAMMGTCYAAAGNRWPNFIAVDYYQRSDGAGASDAVDRANGHMTCGCDNIAYCKINAPFGTCDVPVLAPPPPSSLSTPTKNMPSNGYLDDRLVQLRWSIGATLIPSLLLSLL